MPSLFKVAVVLGLIASLPAFSEEHRDGNWWRELNAPQKAMYVTGFFDGMELGHRFSYWGFAPVATKENMPGIEKVANSYAKMKLRYMTNVSSGQVADGLTQFYEDYRNRSISIDEAVWLVANSIAGTPEAKMKELIESFRKNTQ